MRLSNPRRGIVLPDLHFRKARQGRPPGHDSRTIHSVLEYINDVSDEIDHIIILGDIMDFPYFSPKFSKDFPKEFAEDALFQDCVLAKDFLSSLRQISPSIRIVIIEGNHDYRIKDYMERNPQVGKYLHLPTLLGLDELDIKFVPFWQTGESVDVGKACFIHGIWHNVYHAKKHAEWFVGENVFYGHTHQYQSFCLGKRKTGHNTISTSLGMLCRYDQPYMMGKPSTWVQMFAEFHYFPGGQFNHYPILIFNHKFIAPNGERYSS